jgi:hypothetical protein
VLYELSGMWSGEMWLTDKKVRMSSYSATLKC